MESFVPFKTPTFYTPTAGNKGNNALAGTVSTPTGVKFYTPNNLGNALNPANLVPQKIDPTRSINALRNLLNQDLGQSPGDTPSTGGDANQGAGVAQDPASMDTAALAEETGQLDAFGDAVSIGSGLGFSFDPVGMIAGLYAGGKSKLNKIELQKRNDLMAPEDEVSVPGFSLDPGLTDQQIAEQNKNLQRSVNGTDQGISRNDPNPAPTGDPGDGQGGKIICNELYRQGLMPRHIWEADERFGETLDIDTLQGYHRWAGPWVRAMRASTTLTRLTWLVARPWAQHMAFKMGAVEKDSFIGRQVMRFGLPLCRLCNRRRKRHQRPFARG